LPNISIAILISRLLDRNTVRTALLYALVILQVVLAIIAILILFLQCRPVELLWNHAVTGTCLSIDVLNNYSYFLSAYTTVTDIILAALPITIVCKLQMGNQAKLGICMMMGLTLISAIVTIIKATYLHLLSDVEDPR